LSCVRRAVDFEMSSSGQQYAFIRYSSPQEAQYAIQCGEIEINGRKMFVFSSRVVHCSLLTVSRIIKPRDKKGARSQRQNSHGNSESNQPSSYGSKAGDQILRMINKNHEGQTNRNNNQHFEKQQHYDGRMDFPNSGMKAAASRNQPGSTGPPVFMSKSLTVANLPEEMTPKGLYGLFTEIGPVDGVYIFPMCDQAGRRYGHIVMKSYYYAQKVRPYSKSHQLYSSLTINQAVEQLHGIHFQGHILDVSYFNGKHVDAVSQTTHRPPVPSMPIGNHQMGPMYGHSQPIPVPQAQGSHFPQQNQPPLGWIQQGMGPASRPFVGMPQYGIPQQPMMPGFNGQTVAYGQQPMDFARYNSPPLPTPSPPGFTVVPDQRYHFNGKQRQRPYGPPPGLGASPARPHGQSISSSEYRSFSDSAASCATMISSIPTSAQESPKQSIGDRPAEEPKLDMQELDFGSGPVSDSGTTTPPVFKIETAPIIPEVKKPVDPCNLYVKNLDDELVSTSEDLKKVFDPYGQVASAFLAIYPDSKISKGYGFVAFAKAEDASNAKEKLQNTILGKKRVFISWAERKEDRSKRLKWIMDGKKGANPEDELKEEKSEDSTTANADKGGTKPEVSEEVKSEEHQMSTEVPSDPSSRVTSGEQDSSSPNSIADKVPQEDKVAPKDKMENKATQKPVTAPTVGSVKGWHSTPLTGSKLISPFVLSYNSH
jgi:RNA recognition motif-containing protein